MLQSPAVIAAIIAPWAAITTFLRQQRISRVQKIYYEESLFRQLNHLDDAIDITSKNYALFENGMNLIVNDLRGGTISSLTILSLNEIAKQISISTRYRSSKREILVILFKQYGYTLYQWLLKFDRDFSTINSYIREVLSRLSAELQINGQISEIEIVAKNTEIDDLYQLLIRHDTILYLFNNIVCHIGSLDFKSREALIKDVSNDSVILASLKKIDEVFKMLFGYFKLEDKVFLSYLKDKNGKRFKIHFNHEITISQIDHQEVLDQNAMKIVMVDLSLAAAKIEVDGVNTNYSNVQLGMSNVVAFEKKPSFYSEAESFDNFGKG